MIYEWSPNYKNIDEFMGFKLKDKVYFPHPIKNKIISGKIIKIIIDEQAPRDEFKFCYIIVKRFFKNYKIKNLKLLSFSYKENFNYKRYIEKL